MDYQKNDFVIFRGDEVIEVINGPTDGWDFGSDESNARRAAMTERANARAFEVGGLAYEVRNPNWLEPSQDTFACVEVSAEEVAVTTPIGRFFLKATRARRGDLIEATLSGSTVTAGLSTAKEDQVSLPVEIVGRLLAPQSRTTVQHWRFQPSYFRYADGTVSDYLGSYPREIRWEAEPNWPVPSPEERSNAMAERARGLLAEMRSK